MVDNGHLSDKAKHDLVLVEAARKGNQAAYADLMERYRDSIYFMMLKMVKNSDDADDLTIEAASAKVHVSPAAFSRFFKRSLGKTFTEYVNDLRCTEAAIQLRKTDKPIANVAQECGFATLSHFNRQFLLRHGQTPRHYRKAA